MCNLFHHLLKEVFWIILTFPMRILKYIMWEVFTAPMCMLKYILGPQETYEEVVCNNPSKAIKNARSEDEKRSWK